MHVGEIDFSMYEAYKVYRVIELLRIHRWISGMIVPLLSSPLSRKVIQWQLKNAGKRMGYLVAGDFAIDSLRFSLPTIRTDVNVQNQ